LRFFMIKNSLFTLLAAIAVASLSACGGGEMPTPSTPAGFSVICTDSATKTSLVSQADAQTQCPALAVNSDIVNAVPSSSYAASSEEIAAYSLLNTERNRCGFGMLTQSLSLDAAAKAHADYQIINSLNSHLEDPQAYPMGFTGVTAEDRVLAKGYTGAGHVVDQFVVFNTSDPAQVKTGFGVRGIRSLLNAPYHVGGILSGMRDAGIAVRTKDDVASGGRGIFVQIDTAYKTADGGQLFGATDAKTYPCEGSVGVDWKMSGEVPNPVPGRNLVTNPLGSTVYIAVHEGNTLIISNASMTDVTTGSGVTLRKPVTAANDPYAPCAEGCYKSHQGYIAADAPLAPNTSYSVVVNGSNNGTPFSRSFMFTTGR
jgi:hypothetical protein